MRDIIIIGSLALLLSGCVCTIAIVKPEPLEVRVYRAALFYRADIPKIGRDGVEGYSGSGDEKAIAAAGEKAAEILKAYIEAKTPGIE